MTFRKYSVSKILAYLEESSTSVKNKTKTTTTKKKLENIRLIIQDFISKVRNINLSIISQRSSLLRFLSSLEY